MNDDEFERFMATWSEPKSWDKPHPSGIWRGLMWGFLLVSPFWMLVFLFFIR